MKNKKHSELIKQWKRLKSEIKLLSNAKQMLQQCDMLFNSQQASIMLNVITQKYNNIAAKICDIKKEIRLIQWQQTAQDFRKQRLANDESVMSQDEFVKEMRVAENMYKAYQHQIHKIKEMMDDDYCDESYIDWVINKTNLFDKSKKDTSNNVIWDNCHNKVKLNDYQSLYKLLNNTLNYKCKDCKHFYRTDLFKRGEDQGYCLKKQLLCNMAETCKDVVDNEK